MFIISFSFCIPSPNNNSKINFVSSIRFDCVDNFEKERCANGPNTEKVYDKVIKIFFYILYIYNIKTDKKFLKTVCLV